MRLLTRSKPDIEKAYGLYADMLYRVAFTHLANDADAQDAVQDVFMKYMTKSPVFDTSEHERAWFLRTTVNRCVDIVRSRKIRHAKTLDDAFDVAVPDQYGDMEFMDTVRKIPEKYRNVVILHCLEGFSLEETASVLNISLSAAKMRLSRARDTLRILRKENDDV